ncbi:hypothetical protein V8E36_003645 [Tilletia maclaganii]
MSVLTLGTATRLLPSTRTTTTRSGRTSRTPARFIQDTSSTLQSYAEEEEEERREDEDSSSDHDDRDDAATGSKSAASNPIANTALRIQDQSRPFACEHPGCSKTFAKRNKLNRHALSHSNERKYACQHPGCDKKFLRAQHLAAHQQTHSSRSSSSSGNQDNDAQKPFACTHVISTSTTGGAVMAAQVCSKRFWTKQKLDRHLRSVHEVCPPGETLDDAEEELALQESHNQAESSSKGAGSSKVAGKLYYCDNASCNKFFRKRKHLRAHIWDAHSDAPHLSPYTTSTPAKAQNATTETAASARDDEGENDADADPAKVQLRPFACSWPGCTLRFPSNSHRRIHEQRHEANKAKTYTCALPHPDSSTTGTPAAGVLTFATWSLLRTHMREAHPPRCPRAECRDSVTGVGRSFKSAEGLKAHLKRHEEKDALLAAEDEAAQAAQLADATALDDGDEDAEVGGSSTPVYGDPAKTGFTFQCTYVTPGSSSGTCLKRFKTARARDVHTRVVHLGERRFECTRGCGKRFGYKCTKERHEALGKCVPLAGNEEEEKDAAAGDGDDDEEEPDDDYFREEGGAVPERDAERPPAPVTSHIARPSNAPIGPRLGTNSMSKDFESAVQMVATDKGKKKKKDTPAHTGRMRGLQAYGVGLSLSHTSSSNVAAAATASDAATTTAASGSAGPSLYELFTGEGYAPPATSLPPSPLPSPAAQRAQAEPSARKRTLSTSDGPAADQAHQQLMDGAVGEEQTELPEAGRSPSKRRKTRGRIYACPWRRLVELRREASGPSGSDVTGAEESSASGKITSAEDDGIGQDHSDAEASSEDDEDPSGLPDCAFRFSRMYDLRRHVLSHHGVDLTAFDKGAMEVIMQSD